MTDARIVDGKLLAALVPLLTVTTVPLLVL